MREHQININLKAQQFEELQRLAREQGFKSVAAYIKMKIIDLMLGAEQGDGDEKTGQTTSRSMQRQAVSLDQATIFEVERIHFELRGFVRELAAQAQSQISEPPRSTNLLDPAGNSGISEIPAPGQDFTAGNATNIDQEQDDPFALPQDEPGQAFSLFSNSMSSDDFADQPPLDAASSPQVLPSGNLGGFGFGLGTFWGGNRNNFLAQDKLGSYREILDDLEEMADRAFAISPRLGALDEIAEKNEESGAVQNETEDSTDGKDLPVFVEPIVPDQLPDYDGMDVSLKVEDAISSGTFPALLDDEYYEESDTPTYVPPKAPVPPKPSPEELARIEAAKIEMAKLELKIKTPQMVDELLSDLLDESLIKLASIKEEIKEPEPEAIQEQEPEEVEENKEEEEVQEKTTGPLPAIPPSPGAATSEHDISPTNPTGMSGGLPPRKRRT